MTARDSILIAALFGLACAGCADMSRLRSEPTRQPSALTVAVADAALPLSEWRATVIESARLVFAGKYDSARGVLIDLARAIYAAQQRAGWSDYPASLAAAAQPAATEPQDDSAAIKGVRKRAGEALSELPTLPEGQR